MSFSKTDRVKLVNGRVADVVNGCYYDPHISLILQNGKIVAMPGIPGEPDGQPVDAEIDLHGMTVIPGLFNTHCHLQFLTEKGEDREQQISKNLSDCLERGVTNIRDTLSFDLQQNRTWIEKISRGEISGPRIHQAVHIGPLGGTYSPRFTLQNHLMFSVLGWFHILDYGNQQSGVVAFRPNASPQEVRDAVNRAIDERGATTIKLCDQHEHFMTYAPGAAVLTSAQLEAAVDQARRRGIPTTIHNVTVSGFRQAVKAGITSLAHLPLDGELTQEDVTLLLDTNTSIEPTLTVGYFMSYSMKNSPVSGHPEIQRLDQWRETSYSSFVEESWLPAVQKSHMAQHEALRTGEMKIFGILDISGPFRYMAKYVPVGGKNLQILVEQGGQNRLGCGNDAGASNCSPAVVDLELDMLNFAIHQDGKPRMTAADALRIATLQSARSMGVEDQYGSISPGKTADLAVIEGDPLQDFHRIGKPVQALFLDGRLVINRCGLQVTCPNP